MNYEFPPIQHISDVRPLVENRDEFVISVDEDTGITSIDYVVMTSDTFPPVIDLESAILRECRGIKFYSDGSVAARPYHKFFNAGERDETQLHNIPMERSAVWMEKLDGSMVHPVYVDDRIRFCTRKGLTEVANMADNSRANTDAVNKMCRDTITRGMTPIFEFCSRKNRVVVDHPVDRLVLTGVRSNYDGHYMPYEDMVHVAELYGIEVVKVVEADFMSYRRFLDSYDGEGVVVRFSNGHMLKMKTDWYLRIHKAMEKIVFEKDVIGLIVNGELDDVIPHVMESDRERLIAYREYVLDNIKNVVEAVKLRVRIARDMTNAMDLDEQEARRWFACNDANQYNGTKFECIKPILFKAWEGQDAMIEALKLVDKNLGSGSRVERIRGIVGEVKWEDF